VAVETEQAIITYLSNRLTTDATLKSLLGTPISVYRILATAEPAMPYFRHRLRLENDLLRGVHMYYLDLWYYGANPTVADSAIDRVKILLHEHRYTTAFDEATGTINWAGGGYEEDTGNAKVFHWASRWHIEVGAARDTTNIV